MSSKPVKKQIREVKKNSKKPLAKKPLVPVAKKVAAGKAGKSALAAKKVSSNSRVAALKKSTIAKKLPSLKMTGAKANTKSTNKILKEVKNKNAQGVSAKKISPKETVKSKSAPKKAVEAKIKKSPPKKEITRSAPAKVAKNLKGKNPPQPAKTARENSTSKVKKSSTNDKKISTPVKKIQQKQSAEKKSELKNKKNPKKVLPKVDVAGELQAVIEEINKDSLKKKESKKNKKTHKVSEAPLSGLIDEPEIKKTTKRPQRVRHSVSIYFSMEDLDAYFKDRANGVFTHETTGKKEKSTNIKKNLAAQKVQKQKRAAQSFDAASISDILGFNPVEVPTREKYVEKEIPRKWKKYYNILVQMRKKHSQGLTERSEEVLKRSAKEDAGDLSSYGQHLADAGSESFERDMAYSLLSSEREIIHEIDSAIERMKKGTYGICEYTGAQIPEDRLTSIPFTRYTKEGQERKEIELRRAKTMQRISFGDIPTEGVSGEEDSAS